MIIFFYPVHQAQNQKSQIRKKFYLSSKGLVRDFIYTIILTLLEREFIISMTISRILAYLLQFWREDDTKST